MRAMRRILAVLGMMAALSAPGFPAGAADPTVLRFNARGPLLSLDPIARPSYATLDHAYMVYDTLYALDENLVPKPQMAEGIEASADGRVQIVTLREGLQWHDGTPVTPADSIASLQRWGERDGFGRELMARVERMAPVGERGIEIRLKQPFPLLTTALAKPLGLVPFMMPARIALTPPDKPIAEAIGSGPFRYVAAERDGNFKAVYVRNPAYRARADKPSLFAGAKPALVDRVEAVFVPDLAVATFELYGGWIQYWRTMEADALPRVEHNPDVVLRTIDPFGDTAILRLNHRTAPFDDARIRQAALLAVDQAALAVAMGPPVGDARVCSTLLPCGWWSGNQTAIDPRPAADRRSAARQLLRDAGYDGRPVVLLVAPEQEVTNTLSRAVAEQLRRVGFAVALNDMPWDDLARRRQSRAPTAEGGWSAFVTRWPVLDLIAPAWNEALRATGDAAWYGWPEDKDLEQLRQDWIDAPIAADRDAVRLAIERRAAEVVPYIPLAQFRVIDGYRATGITDPPALPVLAVWGIARKQ